MIILITSKHPAGFQTTYYNLKNWEKCVGILIDEMHIKEDLVYDKHTGALIGFISLGDVNDQLLKVIRIAVSYL